MSKELEALKRIRQETCPATYEQDFDKNECCNIIEQYILKTQEQEKVISVIKEKKIDTEYLSKCKYVNEYNAHWWCREFFLTKEEFELLKRWVG